MSLTCTEIIERCDDLATLCGAPFESTDERLPANAKLTYNDADDSYTWVGTTEVCWDGQITNEGPNGRPMVWCEHGHITEAPEGFGVVG